MHRAQIPRIAVTGSINYEQRLALEKWGERPDPVASDILW